MELNGYHPRNSYETKKILCATITMPRKWQENLGIQGFTMKASEVKRYIEDELDYSGLEKLTVKIEFSLKTEKWLKSLPEADI